MDMISNLPDSILHYIFSFLPTIYIVQTSVLSKRWRYLWATTPYLNINLDEFFFHKCLWNQEPTVQKFTDFFNSFLIFRDGSSTIQRLQFSSNDYCRRLNIDGLIHYVAKRNVQELELSFDLEEPFSLPHCLISCDSLMFLKLVLFHNVLKLPTSMGFSRLITLSLVKVKFSDEGLAQQLFSNCPLLENLCLVSCVFGDIKVLDISAAKLKNIIILNSDFTSFSGLHEIELKISAPSLLSFKYKGALAHDYSFHSLSSLVEVFVHIMQDDNDPDMSHELGCLGTKMIRGFYNAKVLALSMACLEILDPVLNIPALFPTFYNLKSLKLICGVDKCYFNVTAHLLKCSPNLEYLAIDIDGEPLDVDDESPGEDYWNKQDVEFTCLIFHLKAVDISNLHGGVNELGFVNFLLKNGRVLEKMVITWSKYVEKQMELIQNVLAFPRVSSSVAIINIIL